MGQDETARIDRVFAALGDATRRDILRRAALGEHSVSALARHYAMSLTAVQKHVSVLERAALVSKRRSGREQIVSTDLAALQEARRQLETLEALWRGRLDRFGEVLAKTQAPPARPDQPARPDRPARPDTNDPDEEEQHRCP